MSNKTNDELVERANELIEEITNHPSGYDKVLQNALNSGDLDKLFFTVSVVEGELAKENFYSRGIF
jgi:hypothetical protein